MNQIIEELHQIVRLQSGQFTALSESAAKARPAPGKWSKKDILGHLIDSAQNNIQRFVRTQYEPDWVRIKYRQDDWVRVQNYQDYPYQALIQLWELLNRHLCHIWMQMDEQAWTLECNMGDEAVSLWTLRDLAQDYIRHLKHHLAQIDSF